MQKIKTKLNKTCSKEWWKAEKMFKVWGIRFTWELIILSGDVESNPGPAPSNKRSTQKGGTTGSNGTAENAEKFEKLENTIIELQAAHEKLLKHQNDFEVNVLSELKNLKENSEMGTNGKHVGETVELLRNKVDKLLSTVSTSESVITNIIQENKDMAASLASVEQVLKNIKNDSSGRMQNLASAGRDQRKEFSTKFSEIENEIGRIAERLDLTNVVLDDVQEKMYEFEQNKKNNLIFYGITHKTGETTDVLKARITAIFRDCLNIRRELPIARTNRIYTGPEVRGCRPVLVTFENFKDRETILHLAKVLKKSNLHVTEDLSRRTRENRVELRRFMRHIKRVNPEKNCFLEYDRLYIDHKIFVWNDYLAQVVELAESQRYGGGDIFSRPGTMLGHGRSTGMIPGSSEGDLHLLRSGHSLSVTSNCNGSISRSPSIMNGPRTASGDVMSRSASSIPRLPPLGGRRTSNAATFSANGSRQINEKNKKFQEMEKLISNYEEKLESVSSDYEEKVLKLEKRLEVQRNDKDVEKGQLEENEKDGSEETADYLRGLMDHVNDIKNSGEANKDNDDDDDNLVLDSGIPSPICTSSLMSENKGIVESIPEEEPQQFVT